jgi:choline dehydrogenase-like flavoprotein
MGVPAFAERRSQSGGDDRLADVVVIGAGAAGSIAARELARAGLSVVCLEQGGWTLRADFPGERPEWELVAQHQWHADPNVRQSPADYPVDVSQSEFDVLMYNGVGGSTVLYAANWVRLTPSDFAVRTLDGVADDWPVSYEDLAPFYERVDQDMGVSGLGGDPAYPSGGPPPLPPLPIGAIGRRAAEGMDRLGWHWWPGANAIASRQFRGRSACVRQGTCMSGCPHGAKATTDITHWPDALAHGAVLVTGARVREISVDRRGRANGAVYVDLDGREHFQRGSAIVLASNGVGTARLLLASRSALFPDGLANSSGLVGRRLMMHPFAAVVGVYDEPLESWLGPAGQTIQSMQFYETDLSRGFVRGAKWNVVPTGGPLGARWIYGQQPLEEQWGAGFHRGVARALGRSFQWGIMAEELPDEDNRVTLDPSLTDSNGIPAPRVDYHSSENAKAIIAYHVERAREAHAAAGAVETVTRTMRDCGWHLLGTARMGHDPRTSVVDQWGRSHDVSNLFIIDGSVFVTAGAVNPTSTIMALALRSTEHLIEQRRHQAVPG